MPLIKFRSLYTEHRAIYSYTVHGNVIAIIDHDEGKNVTNDAENVIDDLVRQGFDLAQYRVIYRDTRGIWDELLVDRTGHFAGFSIGLRLEKCRHEKHSRSARLTKPPCKRT